MNKIKILTKLKKGTWKTLAPSTVKTNGENRYKNINKKYTLYCI